MPQPHPNRPELSDETGQTLSEYSLLVALIAIVVAVAVPGVTSGLLGFFQNAASAFGG